MSRSTNEDVQWQAAGTVYNILSVPESQPDMLARGVIQLLLDLAAGGYTGVRHVCSACLHLCPPENMPDLSDPAALQLVLCLLEVDGDKFAMLGEKSNDMIPYTLPNVNRARLGDVEWGLLYCAVFFSLSLSLSSIMSFSSFVYLISNP